MRFEQAGRSHVGCRRKNNEDALLLRADLGLWAVADGMGGHAAGDVASALVVEKLEQVAPALEVATRGKAAHAAIESVNQDLWRMTAGSGRTMGSTVVALVAGKEGFSCLWAGDSRAYLWRGGSFMRLTHDHSLVQQLVDTGDLTPAQAIGHPNANIITRAVGSAPVLALDHVAGEVRQGDVFLLASDGITQLFSDDELAEVGREADLEIMADRWVETALARGAPDNLTFVIVRIRAT